MRSQDEQNFVMNDSTWVAGARPVTDVRITISLPWRGPRAWDDAWVTPVGPGQSQITLPADYHVGEAETCSALALPHIDGVLDHYRQLREAHRKAKELPFGNKFWIRTQLYGADWSVGLPWYDTWREALQFFSSVASLAEGEQFSDLDQGWMVMVVRTSAGFAIRECNWEDADFDDTQVLVPQEALLAQIRVARLRTAELLQCMETDPGLRFPSGYPRSERGLGAMKLMDTYSWPDGC